MNKIMDVKKLSSLRVVLTTDNEYHYKEDLKSLNKLSIQIANRFSSGTGTIDYVKHNLTHIVISDTQISDMHIITLLRKIRKEVKNYVVPVIVISTDSEREFVLDVIGAGCSGFVIRPYRVDTLLNYIMLVIEQKKFLEIEEDAIEFASKNIASGKFDEGIEIIEEIIKDREKDEAEEVFEQGTQYLIDGKYNLAIIAFNKALKINNLMIKCYTGLAEAYKGKGDMEKYKYYLQKAADEYAKRDNFDEVKELFIKILKTDPNAPNPYNTLGIQFRKKGKYKLAINAYKQALKLNPYDENIHFNMAKALFFANRYDLSLKFIKNAKKINPDFTEADQLEKLVLKKLEKKDG